MTCGLEAIGKMPAWQQQPSFEVSGMVGEQPVVVTRENFSELACHLTHVSLCNKGLKSVPEEVFCLTNLERLDLSGNEITDIPQKIFNLRKLKVLILNSNQLCHFPPIPENLEKLYVRLSH